MATAKLNHTALAVVLLAALAMSGCGGGDGAQEWDYTLRGQDGNTVFNTKRFTLVFANQPLEGSYKGAIRVAGAGQTSQQTQTDSGTFSYTYSDGQATIQYAGQTIYILDEGRTIDIGDFSTSLSGEHRIVIGADGQISVNPRG